MGSTPPQGYSRAGRPRPKVQETFIPSSPLPGSPPLWSAVPIPGHPKGGGRPGYPTAHLVERRTTLTDHGNPYRRDTEGWLPRLFYEPHGPLPFSRPLLGPPRKQAEQRPVPGPCLIRRQYFEHRETASARPRGAYPASGISISQVRPWLRQGFRDTPTCLRPTGLGTSAGEPVVGRRSCFLVLPLPEDPFSTPAPPPSLSSPWCRGQLVS